MPGPVLPGDVDESEGPWLPAEEVRRIWRIRSRVIAEMADVVGVRYTQVRLIPTTSGAQPAFLFFHPGDVRRAESDLIEGRIQVPRIWRTDTPEGQEAHRREVFREKLHSLGCFIVPLLGFGMLFLLYALLH